MNGRTNKNYIALATAILRAIREEYEGALLLAKERQWVTKRDEIAARQKLRRIEDNIMSDYVSILVMSEKWNPKNYINMMRKQYGLEEREFDGEERSIYRTGKC